MGSPSKDPRDYYDPERDKRFNPDWLASGYAHITPFAWALRGLWLILFFAGVLIPSIWFLVVATIVLLVGGVVEWRNAKKLGTLPRIFQ